MLETGIRGKQSVAVTPENTAKTMGSGTLNVFATPALVALAEKTCWMMTKFLANSIHHINALH